MSEDLADRISRPENCVLGFGIPTSEAGFRESSWRAGEHSFVKSFDDLLQYRRQVIAPYRRLETRIRRLGVRIVPDLTLARFAALFEDPRTHAVALVSHWGGDFVEFRDGPASCDALIAAIPESFAGVIDLCVCHPRALIPHLRVSRPGCLIHYIGVQATPVVWLHYFGDLFFHLRQGKRSYLDAALELSEAYFERSLEVRGA